MFGDGIRYWICKIPMDEFLVFEKIHIEYDLDYESIFFNLELLERIGYSNWENIHCIHKGRGFFIKERNQIEVKLNSKRLAKFDSLELLHSPLLLDKYSILKDDLKLEKSDDYMMIALIQFETGSFFKFKLNKESFSIKKLIFILNYGSIHEQLEEQFVSTLNYEGGEVLSQDEDVVSRGCRVVFL